MGDSADWNEDNTALVCELFAEQVKAHNRSGTHLNKTGYKNVMDKFKEKTGLSYTKMQFKNKWDKMRIEYTNWKRLSKETDLGWDTAKKTWSATNERWKNLNKVIELWIIVFIASCVTCYMSNIFFLLMCSNTRELPSLKMGLCCMRKKKPSCIRYIHHRVE